MGNTNDDSFVSTPASYLGHSAVGSLPGDQLS